MQEPMEDIHPFLSELAARQWADYQAIRPGMAFQDRALSLTTAEAYAVQAQVVRLRCAAGDAVVGYKVGCIGPGIQKQRGLVGPIHGRLFRSEVRHSGDVVPYRTFENLAIEGEMAVRIGADLEIVAAFPVIELHHFVYRGERPSLGELIANNGINAGVVLPIRMESTPPSRWTGARELSIEVNGKGIDRGELWGMPGGAAAAVRWLRDSLAQSGSDLRDGDLVLTATPLGLHPVRPGDHVVVSVDGEPFVECYVS